MSNAEILTRIAVLETEMTHVKDELKAIRKDVSWIRDNMANASEVDRLASRVNGLTKDYVIVADTKDYVKLLLQWALQGGIMASVIVFALKFMHF